MVLAKRGAEAALRRARAVGGPTILPDAVGVFGEPALNPLLVMDEDLPFTGTTPPEEEEGQVQVGLVRGLTRPGPGPTASRTLLQNHS